MTMNDWVCYAVYPLIALLYAMTVALCVGALYLLVCCARDEWKAIRAGKSHWWRR